jgi:hypothetical protein
MGLQDLGHAAVDRNTSVNGLLWPRHIRGRR